MFKDIFRELIQNQGVTAYQMSKETGISEALISNWKSGRQLPKYDSLNILADYFNVSGDYLLGRVNIYNGMYSITGDNNVQVNGNNSHTTVTNSENKRQDTIVEEFIQIFENLSFEDKLAVMDFAMSKINK